MKTHRVRDAYLSHGVQNFPPGSGNARFLTDAILPLTNWTWTADSTYLPASLARRDLHGQIELRLKLMGKL